MERLGGDGRPFATRRMCNVGCRKAGKGDVSCKFAFHLDEAAPRTCRHNIREEVDGNCNKDGQDCTDCCTATALLLSASSTVIAGWAIPTALNQTFAFGHLVVAFWDHQVRRSAQASQTLQKIQQSSISVVYERKAYGLICRLSAKKYSDVTLPFWTVLKTYRERYRRSRPRRQQIVPRQGCMVSL